MMALFGWLCMIVFMFMLTASWFMLWLNHGGRWTIGGAENSTFVRIVINLIAVPVFGQWYLIFTEAPFSVTLNG